MTKNLLGEAVVVSLPISFLDALLKMHGGFDPDVLAALHSGFLTGQSGTPAEELTSTSVLVKQVSEKYSVEFLGITISGRILPDIFAQIVDMTAIAAPEALEELAVVRPRTRRYVSRTPEAIHPGNRQLPVMPTTSGWWVSKNIGKRDLNRALLALASAAGLTFGQDVIFPRGCS
jgi:hypothetical protein